MKKYFALISIIIVVGACTQQSADKEAPQIDPLPSWNEGENKTAILDFVDKVTDANSKGFVPIEDRIAVFDNDGTLWIEKPLYIPVEFEMAWLKVEAENKPELLNNLAKDPVLKYEQCS